MKENVLLSTSTESVVEGLDTRDCYFQAYFESSAAAVKKFLEFDWGPRSFLKRIKVETRLYSVFSTEQDPDIAQERLIASGDYSDVYRVLAFTSFKKLICVQMYDKKKQQVIIISIISLQC